MYWGVYVNYNSIRYQKKCAQSLQNEKKYFMHSYNSLVKMRKIDSLQDYEHSTMTRLGAVWGGMLLVAAA